MIRILIWDTLLPHANNIITAISTGYGSDISNQCLIVSSDPFVSASLDNNIIAIVRSYSGWESNVSQSLGVYPNTLTFFPAGSNTFSLVAITQESEIPNLVLTGAGDVGYEDKNNTGYGIEFWDSDLNLSSTSDESSYSTGIILGKLLKIKDTLNCSWWEARYRARKTTDRNESNRLTSEWDLYNGYGIINVNNAINYSGEIISDPFLPLPSPLIYYNTSQTYTAYCSTGYSGSNTVTIENNIFSSSISQADANNLAYNFASSSAINNLTCYLLYYNNEQSYTAIYPNGYSGSYTSTIPANTFSSSMSQEYVNNLAYNLASSSANLNLVCTLITTGYSEPIPLGGFEMSTNRSTLVNAIPLTKTQMNSLMNNGSIIVGQKYIITDSVSGSIMVEGYNSSSLSRYVINNSGSNIYYILSGSVETINSLVNISGSNSLVLGGYDINKTYLTGSVYLNNNLFYDYSNNIFDVKLQKTNMRTSILIGNRNKNLSGTDNIIFGNLIWDAMSSGSHNILIGDQVGGSVYGYNVNNCIMIGSLTYFTSSGVYSEGDNNVICIGYNAIGNGNNTVTLGNDNIIKTFLKGSVYLNNNLFYISSSNKISSSFISELNTNNFNTDMKEKLDKAFNNNSENLIIGNNSGILTNCYGDIIIGVNASPSVIQSSQNVIIGNNTATTGYNNRNVAIGNYSLQIGGSLNNNIAIGYESGYNLLYSEDIANIFIGYRAGKYIYGDNGEGNVILGNYSGIEFVDSEFYVDNLDTNVLIGSYIRPKYELNGNEKITSNQIIIGFLTNGNGPNTVTLGNDDITKTFLKGNVGIKTNPVSHSLEVSGSIYASEYFILKSPNGNKWKISVDDSGNLNSSLL